MKKLVNYKKLSISLFSLICIFGFGFKVNASDAYLYPFQEMEFSDSNVCVSYNKACVSALLKDNVCTLKAYGQSCVANVSVGNDGYKNYTVKVGRIRYLNLEYGSSMGSLSVTSESPTCKSSDESCLKTTATKDSNGNTSCKLVAENKTCFAIAYVGNNLYRVNVTKEDDSEHQDSTGDSSSTGGSTSSGGSSSTGSGSSSTGGSTDTTTGDDVTFQLGTLLNLNKNFSTESCSGTCGVASYLVVDGKVNITATNNGSCSITCKTSEAISNLGVDSYTLKIDVSSDNKGNYGISPQAIINTKVGGIVLGQDGISMTSPGGYYVCEDGYKYIGKNQAVPTNCFYSLIQFDPRTISTSIGNDVNVNNTIKNMLTDIVNQVIKDGNTGNIDKIISDTINKYSSTVIKDAINVILGGNSNETITNILNSIQGNNNSVKLEDIINGLINNGQVSGILGNNFNTSNSSSSTTQNTCTSLKIFQNGFYPSNVDGFKGYSTYNGQSGIHLYEATANCTDDKTTIYDAFCIDPAMHGPHQKENGDSRSYYNITDTVDLNTEFGRAIYILYRDYYANTGKTAKDLYIATQVSRFLLGKIKDGKYEFLGWDNGPYKDKAQAYMNSAVTSDVRAIYEDVLNKAKSEDFSASEVSIDVSHSSGDNVEDGIKFIVTAKNVTDISKVTDLNLYVVDNNTKKDISSMFTISKGEWKQKDKDYVMEVTVKAFNLDEDVCEVILLASAKYNGENDVANIGIATSTTSSGTLQRFLIFNKSGVSNINDYENFKVNKTCNSNSACTPVAEYTCDDASSVTYVVEGTEAKDSNVKWESCIIGEEGEDGNVSGGKDPNGNTYELQEDNGYCAIYCKEDYAFKVPGNLNQYSANGNGFAQGRYISINLDKHYHAVAGLAGQKTCVTSEVMTEKFLKDSVEQKKDLLDAVNRYYKYKAQKEALENSDCLDDPTSNSIINYTYSIYKFENSSTSHDIIESNIVLLTSSASHRLIVEGSKNSQTSGTGNNIIDNIFGNSIKKNNYNELLSNINNGISTAQKDYNDALNKLNNQVDKIQDCTTWTDEEKLKDSYEFEPEIRFDYAENEYIDMMNGNNKLQPEKEVTSTTLGYYCEDNKETVVETGSCSTSVSDDNKITVKVPNSSIENATKSTDEIYYEYKRITGIVKYGDPGVALDGTRKEPELIYYKSSVPFYTHPNKGIVTTDNTDDSTLIDIGDKNRPDGTKPDGLVYPIKLTTPAGIYDYKLTFKNIGQYFMTDDTLGRIMGNNNGQEGYLTVNESDSYLCKYTVCAIDDPNCDNTPDGNEVCSNILASDVCKSGDIEDLDECISALLDKECCDEVINLNKMTINMVDRYNAVCPKQKYCQGFGIIEGNNGTSNDTGSAIIVNGKLEFTPKSVSLNNLFPNSSDSKGFNWVGTTHDGTSIGSIIEDIESAGESIYNNEPDFKIVINATCRAKILEYNNTQENNSLGFNDYTLSMNSSGTYDTSTFLAQLEAAGCIVEKDFD